MGRLLLDILADCEGKLIVERVNVGIAATRASGTRLGRPLWDLISIADKLAFIAEARVRVRNASVSLGELVRLIDVWR